MYARMHKHASLLIAGGLAAPALAAVAGSVATTIGGSAAAATAVTGMMGSSVGAASMIAGFGYYGGRVTADHMARRIGTFTPSIPRSLHASFMHACMLSLSPRSGMHPFASHSCQLIRLPHSINPPSHMFLLYFSSPHMHALIESFFCAVGQTVIQSFRHTCFLW